MKRFELVAGSLFGLIAVLQATRFVAGWTILINGREIPRWPSAAAAVVLGALAVWAFRTKQA